MPAKYDDDVLNQPDTSHPPGHQRVTLKQVAQRAGVSAAAASAALTGRRGTTRVSDDTAEMIRTVAVELGYDPNARARSLVTRRTGVLGLAFPYTAAFWDGNPFNQAVIQGAAETAARLGYHLLLRLQPNHAWQGWDAAALIDSRADGVLVVAPAVDSPLLAALAEADYPAVAAVCDPDHCPIPSVNAADATGACAAVTFLIRLGHRRIGYLMGPEELGPSRARRDGYRAALNAAGLDASERLIARAAPDERGGFHAAVELLSREPRPTALFAFNDLAARGAIDAARRMGLDVPAKLSVVGFDDTDLATRLEPPLTSVSYPAREIAVTALECLAQLVRDASFPPLQRGRQGARPRTERQTAAALTLPTQLVVRQSCAPPATDVSL
jgi:DNA-binding LacI/PurR family transcriptional regulator